MNFLGGDCHWGFQGSAVVKNLPARSGDTRDAGSIPGSGRSPGEGNGTPVFLPGKSHGQRSLAVHGVSESHTTVHSTLEEEHH